MLGRDRNRGPDLDQANPDRFATPGLTPVKARAGCGLHTAIAPTEAGDGMAREDLLHFLVWAAAINYAVILLWFGAFVFAHDRLRRLHARWFALSPTAFDALNYGGIGAYKLGNLLLFVVPASALLLSRPA
jgi:hypothetical protein